MQKQKPAEVDLSNVSFCVQDSAKFSYLEWC